MQEGVARQYGRELLSSFEYMHHRGVVHRDVKMENLMLGHDGNMVVIDFGLSNIIPSSGWLDTQCGSMAYSAPELLGSKRYGKEVDVWGIGVCIYVMLTGKLPFGNPESLTDLHALTLVGDFDLPELMSVEAKDMFIQIFQFKPNRRITIEALWTHPWFDPDGYGANGGDGTSTNGGPRIVPRVPAGKDYTVKLADLKMDCISLACSITGEGESALIHSVLVRCAFFDRNLHSRMPLVSTPAHLKRAGV
jgi:serine/threonine protein kinase